jgi:hypothetical protein
VHPLVLDFRAGNGRCTHGCPSLGIEAVHRLRFRQSLLRQG